MERKEKQTVWELGVEEAHPESKRNIMRFETAINTETLRWLLHLKKGSMPCEAQFCWMDEHCRLTTRVGLGICPRQQEKSSDTVVVSANIEKYFQTRRQCYIIQLHLRTLYTIYTTPDSVSKLATGSCAQGYHRGDGCLLHLTSGPAPPAREWKAYRERGGSQAVYPRQGRGRSSRDELVEFPDKVHRPLGVFPVLGRQPGSKLVRPGGAGPPAEGEARPG